MAASFQLSAADLGARGTGDTPGPIDKSESTPVGGLVLGECKLVRNPQARREVIAQALDYARAIAGWRYEDLEREVRRALKQPTATIWQLVGAASDLDGASSPTR